MHPYSFVCRQQRTYAKDIKKTGPQHKTRDEILFRNIPLVGCARTYHEATLTGLALESSMIREQDGPAFDSTAKVDKSCLEAESS